MLVLFIRTNTDMSFNVLLWDFEWSNLTIMKLGKIDNLSFVFILNLWTSYSYVYLGFLYYTLLWHTVNKTVLNNLDICST